MLKMIRCDKFTQNEVIFNKGLNVVLGDDIATNSIGKTTMLMIIDFVFGGEDYISISNDTVENLGHHKFLFTFIFDKIQYNFIRDTESYDKVYTCDEKFNIMNERDIFSYSKWLKHQYNCDNDELSFRNIVGRFFRIYGKENLNEHKPIQYFEKENASDSINVLIKLFNKYKSIQACSERISDLKENQAILNKVKKKDIISVSKNKTMFRNNEKDIVQLNSELEQLKKDISTQTTNIETLISQEILDLQNRKSKLAIQKNKLSSRLKRAEYNIKSKKSKISLELSNFKEYFPDFNVKKLETVNEFHTKITETLKKELKIATNDIKLQIQLIDEELATIDLQISNTLQLKNSSTFSVDKLIELSSKINKLKEENYYYTKGVNTKENLKTANKTYDELKVKITDDICSQINLLLSKYSKIIYGGDRRSPNFSIHKNSYIFNTFGDTGTGTAFASLISFDLAILQLTNLPALTHDLPLLKNIENEALGNIIKLYCSQNKQIFIAIDKLSSYNDETFTLINNHKVLELSKDKILFNKNWKTE